MYDLDPSLSPDCHAHLGQIQTRAVSTIVVVSIHMEDLLAVYREQTGENALGETRALNESDAKRDTHSPRQ